MEINVFEGLFLSGGKKKEGRREIAFQLYTVCRDKRRLNFEVGLSIGDKNGI